MGYTHYWYLDSEDSNSEAYTKAKEEIVLVIKKKIHMLADGHGKGYPEINDNIICINGKGDDSHEAFYLSKNMSDGKKRSYGGASHEVYENLLFNSCKTQRKPYDDVITAALTILFDRLGHLNKVRVYSDGGETDWENGVALASEVLGREFLNPLSDNEENLIRKLKERNFLDECEKKSKE